MRRVDSKYRDTLSIKSEVEVKIFCLQTVKFNMIGIFSKYFIYQNKFIFISPKMSEFLILLKKLILEK